MYLACQIILWTSLALVTFAYAGYPLLLALIVRVRGARPVRRGDELPSVSFVISAYNEADVIRRKLENTVALVANPFLPKHKRREITPEMMTSLRFGPAIFVGTCGTAMLHWGAR